ncbi:MAG: hypothetical protein A3G38_04025 [Omnitrophica WOR_2 bacterium RIFCSPLOWO2_12_FULL_51_8]|nr:MAG: hypothetical protein A3G38_04025 [Omnitrophica WOR_2 bacterium RIFCSPLOWO2_12_FULL_51_8]
MIRRQLFPTLLKHLKAEEITLLVGARQSGKTTLLKELIRYLLEEKNVGKERVFYFNLDLITDLDTVSDQNEFIQTIKAYLARVGNKKIYCFIDEAQRIENAGIFFKGIYDLSLPVKFILSGSSALEIKSKIGEPLTGRKRLFHLYPFSFREFLDATEPSLGSFLRKEERLPQPIVRKLRELLDEYLIYGGYPKVVLANGRAEKMEFLEEIYSAYIEKDIVGLMKVGEPLVFNDLVHILASEAGNLSNIHSISSALKIDRRKIENFISILEQTFIIKVIHPYYLNVRKTIKKQPKIYFLDQGILNFATQLFFLFSKHPARGQLLENFIASRITADLYSSGRLSFWRTRDQAEVDFVITRGNQIIPIEVKAGELSSMSVSHSMSSFIKHYAPPKMYVVNLALEGSLRRANTKIEYIMPWRIDKLLQS